MTTPVMFIAFDTLLRLARNKNAAFGGIPVSRSHIGHCAYLTDTFLRYAQRVTCYRPRAPATCTQNFVDCKENLLWTSGCFNSLLSIKSSSRELIFFKLRFHGADSSLCRLRRFYLETNFRQESIALTKLSADARQGISFIREVVNDFGCTGTLSLQYGRRIDSEWVVFGDARDSPLDVHLFEDNQVYGALHSF